MSDLSGGRYDARHIAEEIGDCAAATARVVPEVGRLEAPKKADR
jgi:hypothetical protein